MLSKLPRSVRGQNFYPRDHVAPLQPYSWSMAMAAKTTFLSLRCGAILGNRYLGERVAVQGSSRLFGNEQVPLVWR